MSDTDRCSRPPDDDDTDRGGHRVGDARRELDLEQELLGLGDRELILWACRHIYSVSQSLEVQLGQVRSQGRRIGELERRLSSLPSPLPCERADCPNAHRAAE